MRRGSIRRATDVRRSSPPQSSAKPPAYRPLAFGVLCAVASWAVGGIGAAHAGGILLQQTNVSGLGNAHAGGAAIADDASTLFHNPAGLSRLNRPQLVSGGVGVRLKGTYQSVLPPGTPGAMVTYGSQANTPSFAVLPHFYYAQPITDNINVAVGVSAPYGLPVRYPEGWDGRNQAVQTDIKVPRIAAGVSLRLTNSLSVGGTVTVDYFLTKLRQKVPYAQAIKARYQDIPGLTGVIAETVPVLRSACELIPLDGLCKDEATQGPYTADDVVNVMASLLGPSAETGFHGYEAEARIETQALRPNVEVGVLWEPSQDLRVGARFRPRTKFKNKGTIEFSQPDANGTLLSNVVFDVSRRLATLPNNPLANSNISFDITLPQEIQLSVFARLTEKLEVMADMLHQGWGANKELKFVRPDGYVVKHYPQNYLDSTRYAVGANYQLTPKWKLRAGYAWEKSMMLASERNAHLPDNDRKVYAIGAQYKYSPTTIVDIGYNRLAFKESRLGSSGVGPYALDGVFEGKMKATSDMVGAQVTVNY